MQRSIYYVPIFMLGLLAMLFQFAMPNSAEAGIGSIWFTDTTTDSLTVDWNAPTSPYTPIGSQPYRVCWKKAWTWGNVCNQNSALTSDTIFTIDDLNEDTKYKVRVRCYCKKSGWFGGTRWRNIDTDYATTLEETEPAAGTMWVTNVTDHSIEVEWELENVPSPGYLRVCYRAKHSANWFWSLKNNCKPVFLNQFGLHTTPTWTADFLRGWLELGPNTTSIDIIGLTDCMRYDIVLYAFDATVDDDGELIDQVTRKTQGCNWWNHWFRTVSDDRPEVMDKYVVAVDRYYGGDDLYDVLMKQYPELARDASTFNPKDEDLRDTTTMIEYMVREREDVLMKWQNSDELQKAGMSLEQFIERESPELYEFLSVELDPLQDDVEDDGPIKDEGIKR